MRRAAPFAVLLGLVVLLAASGVTAWNVEEPSAPFETANVRSPR